MSSSLKHIIKSVSVSLVAWFVPSLTVAQTNRALIVAISDYLVENGWEETHATNDCELVIPMLKANNYKPANIRTVLNEKATKSNIIKELDLLGRRSRPGDFIYIHFSGHGQQMADDNGDEPDSLDEAFIPYDAYYRYIPGRYEGENHLRDDELEYRIDHIRRQIGAKGNVIVVLDACHSGTGTRIVDDDDYIRGTSYIFAPDNFVPSPVDTALVRLNFHTGEDLSPITVFSACQPDELNYEYKQGKPAIHYGSLSFFFCESVNEHKQPETNHAFFLRLKDKMVTYFRERNRSQTPYFESTAGDYLFNLKSN